MTERDIDGAHQPVAAERLDETAMVVTPVSGYAPTDDQATDGHAHSHAVGCALVGLQVMIAGSSGPARDGGELLHPRRRRPVNRGCERRRTSGDHYRDNRGSGSGDWPNVLPRGREEVVRGESAAAPPQRGQELGSAFHPPRSLGLEPIAVAGRKHLVITSGYVWVWTCRRPMICESVATRLG